MKTRAFDAVGALALVTFAAFAANACSNASESAPSRTVNPAPTATQDDGGGADGGPVDPACKGPEGCFKCEPKQSIELLNACTDGQCTPFDNAARVPRLVPGQALPPVP